MSAYGLGCVGTGLREGGLQAAVPGSGFREGLGFRVLIPAFVYRLKRFIGPSKWGRKMGNGN